MDDPREFENSRNHENHDSGSDDELVFHSTSDQGKNLVSSSDHDDNVQEEEAGHVRRTTETPVEAAEPYASEITWKQKILSNFGFDSFSHMMNETKKTGWIMIRISFPIIFSAVCWQLVGMEDLIFLGHLNPSDYQMHQSSFKSDSIINHSIHRTNATSINTFTFKSEISNFIKYRDHSLIADGHNEFSSMSYIFLNWENNNKNNSSSNNDTTVENYYLSAAALSNSYIMLLYYLSYGFNTGMDTLASQAYGAKNYEFMETVLFRALLIVSFVNMFPLTFLIYYAGYILKWIGQDPFTSEYSGIFCRLSIPGIWGMTIFRTIIQYMVTQRVAWPGLVISLLSLVVNIGLNYLFIYWINLGFEGAAIATSVTRVLNLVSLLLIMFIYKCYYIWKYRSIVKQKRGYVREIRDEEESSDNDENGAKDEEEYIKFMASFTIHKSFLRAFQIRGLWQYLKLALPGMLMITADAWGFGISSVMSGYLGKVPLAAHSIVLNMLSMSYMVPLGIGIAGCVVIGNRIGENKAMLSKFTSYFTILKGTCIMILFSITFVVMRRYIGLMYTNDESVIDIVSQTMLVASLFGIFDGAQVTTASVLRATGKQAIGSVLSMVSYYVIGLPLSAFLAFYIGMGPNGIWLGLLIGVITIASFSFVVIAFRINWQKECDKAKLEVGKKDPIQQEVQIDAEMVEIKEDQIGDNDEQQSTEKQGP